MEETCKFSYSGNLQKAPVFKVEELCIATDKDKDELERLDFFKNGEVELFTKDSSIYIYRIDDKYIACGTFLYPYWRADIPDNYKNKYRDIGMHVSEKYRGKGYGRSMVQNLTLIAISKGFIPITECAIDNKISRATLESAGYILNP